MTFRGWVNWTIVELKLIGNFKIILFDVRVNWTIVELKHGGLNERTNDLHAGQLDYCRIETKRTYRGHHRSHRVNWTIVELKRGKGECVFNRSGCQLDYCRIETLSFFVVSWHRSLCQLDYCRIETSFVAVHLFHHYGVNWTIVELKPMTKLFWMGKAFACQLDYCRIETVRLQRNKRHSWKCQLDYCRIETCLLQGFD
ncbi:MAG: hypothetical protein EZS28_019939 [Streblomastix strix]|uniref:Uncharacterized protein n=1 Tax=Streblomastix strix TaxID=222440 RepID=A0A5J4VPG4_9EUKA|nr:MAG: hypothetical protein EZS28_019939 [Streblomastix strix]